ncbi:hypothetical protein SAMN05444521_1204 [Streptomyces sp. 3214.6]|nr:hypothetical protein SAMN05444521_1204 [Streptomyces sp. 3214.6]
MPYDRIVVAGRLAACNSAKNDATGATGKPLGSSSWYGSCSWPVSANRPISGSTKRDRSRPGPSGSTMAGKLGAWVSKQLLERRASW